MPEYSFSQTQALSRAGLAQAIPAAARSKEQACGRSLAGIMGLNPAGGMDIRVVCCK